MHVAAAGVEESHDFSFQTLAQRRRQNQAIPGPVAIHVSLVVAQTA
ncbi:MAG: hypothetical protein WD042_03165 [Phycisphaeraceae bacterium]